MSNSGIIQWSKPAFYSSFPRKQGIYSRCAEVYMHVHFCTCFIKEKISTHQKNALMKGGTRKGLIFFFLKSVTTQLESDKNDKRKSKRRNRESLHQM